MKGSNKMKTFMVKYTEDFGKSYHSILLEEKTFTKAYMEAYVRLPKEAAITDLFEIL